MASLVGPVVHKHSLSVTMVHFNYFLKKGKTIVCYAVIK